MLSRRLAFTLIELLIVVAIIAILAAIAVPNFLEAQTRAKVSRNMADFRTATTGFEMYRIDHNMYPFDGYFHKDGANGYPTPTAYNHNRISQNLTTPIAYLNTCVFPDPFNKSAPPPPYWQYDNYKYWLAESIYGTKYSAFKSGGQGSNPTVLGEFRVEYGEYLLFAVGPDGKDPGQADDPTFQHRNFPGVSNLPASLRWQPYDPSNGTISIGNIMWSQKSPKGYTHIH